MKDAGLIRHLGLSGVDTNQLDEASAICEVVAIQNRFGIGMQRDETVMQAASSRSIAFVPFFSIAAEGNTRGHRWMTEKKYDECGGPRCEQRRGSDRLDPRLGAERPRYPWYGSVDHLEENVAAGVYI